MNYLNALDAELKQAGIPPRRRKRIVAEFADHLEQDPTAEVGSSQQLGFARGLADAAVCLVGFALLRTYLGLQSCATG